MRDYALYAQILGVKAPWFIDKVDLKSRRIVLIFDYTMAQANPGPARNVASFCPAETMLPNVSGPLGYVSVYDVTSCPSAASGMPGTCSTPGA